MPISDEKVEEIMVAFKDMMLEMKRVQTENSKLHSEMLNMMKEKTATSSTTASSTASNVKEEDVGRTQKTHGRPKPKRPVITEEVDDLEWIIFKDSWNRYKTMTSLEEDKEVCLELREACSAEVNRLLYDYVGAVELNNPALKEETLMAYIKKVAVKSIHPEVYRWNYGKMSQSSGEPVTKYVARLKSQAVLCSYTVNCKCGEKVSYADEMVSQRLVTGLANPEHQSKVLSEIQELPDLQAKIDRIITLETTDDATIQIRTPSSSSMMAAAAVPPSRSCAGPHKISQYKRNKRVSGTVPAERGRKSESTRNQAFRRKCRGCGRTSHPNGGPLVRSECPAFGKTCDVCGIENHFKRVCSKRQSRASYAKMEDDTTGSSESSEDEFADIENTDTENEEAAGQSYYFSARAEGFCRGHHKGCPG